jgi:hypothetical protein
MLFQVVREEPLSVIPPNPDDAYLRRQLSKHPPLYNAARQIHRLFRWSTPRRGRPAPHDKVTRLKAPK